MRSNMQSGSKFFESCVGVVLAKRKKKKNDKNGKAKFESNSERMPDCRDVSKPCSAGEDEW